MWISVKDRLPDPGWLVDVYRRGHGRIPNCLCHKLGATHDNGTPLAAWRQLYGGHAGGASVTHWMEIPGPPEGQDDLPMHRP